MWYYFEIWNRAKLFLNTKMKENIFFTPPILLVQCCILKDPTSLLTFSESAKREDCNSNIHYTKIGATWATKGKRNRLQLLCIFSISAGSVLFLLWWLHIMTCISISMLFIFSFHEVCKDEQKYVSDISIIHMILCTFVYTCTANVCILF